MGSKSLSLDRYWIRNDITVNPKERELNVVAKFSSLPTVLIRIMLTWGEQSLY